jgi:hypothetical protein
MKRRCIPFPRSGSIPSHSGMSDDIWRPGGSIDRDSDFGDDGTVAGSGWSVSQNDSPPVPNNPFVNTTESAGGDYDACQCESISRLYCSTFFSALTHALH